MLNPVLRREAVTLMRTWRTLILISLYTLVLAAVALIALYSITTSVYSGFDPQSTVGIYVALASFQTALILLFVPAIAAGAVSGERERQTLDLMLVTKTSTLSIVTGKLAASLLIVVILIIASLPVFGIVMFFDSVSVLNLLALTLFSFMTAAMVGSLSILMSALYKRTAAAVALTYLVMIIIFFCGFLGVSMFNRMFQAISWFPRMSHGTAFALTAANPVMGLVSVFDSQLGFTNIDSFITSTSYYNQMTGTFQPFVSGAPLWAYNLLFDACVVVVCCLLASKLIKPSGAAPKKVRRTGLKVKLKDE